LESEIKTQFNKKKLIKAVNEIEKGLLVFCIEVHTEKGSHSKLLKTWSHFLKEKGLKLNGQPDILAAKENIDKIVTELNTKFDSKAKLPWWAKNQFIKTGQNNA